MRWRSIEFRLAAWYSLLLLAGLASLGAALWFGVNYSMVAAVDDLLVARSDRLVEIIDAEFGAARSTPQPGQPRQELKGFVEHVDHEGRWFTLEQTRVNFREETVFTSDRGSFAPSELQPGQFVEVTLHQQGNEWTAGEVSLEKGFLAELREELGELALAVPEGQLIHLRTAGGKALLPLDAHSSRQKTLSWQDFPGNARRFRTVETDDGAFRVLSDPVRMAGGSYLMQAAASLAAVKATQERLVSWVLWAIPIGVLLSFSGGLAISRTALRPVERIANVAARMDVDRLSERLEVPATGDVVQRLANTFNEMLSRLERSVKRLEEFTADASHELRSPVSVIRTTAELALRQSRSEEELRKDMAQIRDEAAQLTELIEDLLTLARADSGADGVSKSRVDFVPIAKQVCENYRGVPNGNRLSLDLEPQSAVVHGHAPSLRRLLMILLDNAIRHTRAEASIRVSVSSSNKQVILTVADTGEGIPPDEIERVFDRFYRADPSRNRHKGGFGLGLSIAKWIVESHGGSIKAASRLGEGTTFEVVLPRHAGAPSKEAANRMLDGSKTTLDSVGKAPSATQRG